MFGLSRSASALWLAVVSGAAGALVVSVAIADREPKALASALFFAVACGMAERFKVDMPTSRPGHRVFISVGAAGSIAAVLLFPLHLALVVVALGMALGNRTVWFKRAFNAAQITLAAAAASIASAGLARPSGLRDLDAVGWMTAAVVTYFVASSFLSTWMVALATNMPMRTTLWRAVRHTWPAVLGVLFIGVLIAVLWVTSAWTIVLAAIPLTAVYYAIRNTVRLETQTVEALFNLADILDARDPYTHGHSLRVGQYAEKLALAMGLSGDDAHLIFLSGRLHDIGKCAIRNEVLLKPGALTDEEREHMCIHPEVGGSMLASFSLFSECARYVRGHHERWDGDGYPDKLVGENIPLGARIIAVADTYDAMTTTRPYRKALPLVEAKRRLAEGAGSQWDPRCIAAFLKLLETTPLGQSAPTPLGVTSAAGDDVRAA